MFFQKSSLYNYNFLQFSPCVLFISLYTFLYYYATYNNTTHNSSHMLLLGIPLFTTFITIIYSFFIFKNTTSINKKIEIFLSGVGSHDILPLYFILILNGIFNHATSITNGSMTIVSLSLLYIPVTTIMPSIFLLAAIGSLIIKNSLTTALVFLPITYGIGQTLQINHAFMAATLISGILFGKHISLHTRTLLTTTKTNRVNLFSSLQKTVWFTLPPAVTTLLILSLCQYQPMHHAIYKELATSLTIQSYIPLIPYVLLIVGSFLGVHLIANLTFGSCISLIIGFFQNKIQLLDTTIILFEGFSKQQSLIKILLLYMLFAGLIKLITFNDGFNYLIDQINLKKRKSSNSTQLIIFIITTFINLIIIIDSLSIRIITGIIKKLNDKHKISHDRIINIIEISSQSLQFLLPYAPIVLLTTSVIKISHQEIIIYMIYPVLILIWTLIIIMISPALEQKNIS